MKKIQILFILTIFTILSCGNNQSINKPELVEKYSKFIVGMSKTSFETYEGAFDDFKDYLNIPQAVLGLNVRIDRINTFKYDSDIGLRHPFYPEWPDTLNFPPLRYVFKNGDLLFAGNDYNPNEDLRFYTENGMSIIKIDDLPSGFNDRGLKIKLEGKWQNIIYSNGQATIENGKSTLLEDFKWVPKMFDSKILLGPINNDLAVLRDKTQVYYNEYDFGLDFLFLYYEWREKKIECAFALPFTNYYRELNKGISGAEVIDSKNRLYLAFYTTYQKTDSDRELINTKMITSGHIMIYDPEKDTLYNVRHPFWDEENKNEKMLAYQYVLGEDENIYYQLVTDKAYYVYKLELLWDQPMANDEYKTYFFEFHPELKEAFDGVEVGTSK